MEKTPKISVVIPAFNAQRWIEEAVKSALEQSLPPFEVIVVDDGSTDDTVGILEKFGARIKLIRQSNRGPGSARNEGMKNARGEWIAFLDADDKWLSSKLERVMQFAKQNLDVVLFSHDAFVIDAQGKIVGVYTYQKLPSERQALSLIFRNTVMTSSVVMRCAVVNDVGLFKEDLNVSEDWDYWIRIAEKHRLFHINERLVMYRRLETSAVKSKLDKSLEDSIRVIIGAGKRNQLSSTTLNRAIANLYRESAIRKASALDGKGAKHDIAKAVELSEWRAQDFFLYSVNFLPRSVRKKLLELKRLVEETKALRIAGSLGISHEGQ